MEHVQYGLFAENVEFGGICPVTHGPRDLEFNKGTTEVVRLRSRGFTPLKVRVFLKISLSYYYQNIYF